MKFTKLIKKSLNVVCFFFLVIVVSIIMKIFLFASFKIPTGSMEPVILSGDHVLVNKLLIGPRIYRDFGFLRGEKTPLKRIKGLKNIQRNDILVFNYPYTFQGTLKMSPNQFYIKRCIAVPGDTFTIENGIYTIKGHPEPAGNYSAQLQLSQTPDEVFDKHTLHCFPDDTAYRWTIKHFGPLYIPGKGDCLEVNLPNIVLYRSLIQYETGQKITVQDEQLFLDGDTLFAYTFAQNYYFMAGDYVSGSQDSRYWGLLPEDFVVGKVAFIRKSVDPHTGKFRWKTFFKAVK